ncbi:hypothetical protein [Hydrogenophaga sp. BPS33]|uniref:hypothetical protein n=1 Tax=Hydrogenophaga sp. BPS33 TaxID=2651974 RepID=UPI00131F5817|nr:hypothetical protein [Hydrogenophaga sp. BPS33]QHE84609.1 hypothetical protein F9K07_06765 [Hydrogenophaga sp. BPS33]
MALLRQCLLELRAKRADDRRVVMPLDEPRAAPANQPRWDLATPPPLPRAKAGRMPWPVLSG